MAYLLSHRLRPAQYMVFGLIMIFSILWINTAISYAHGGKKHAENGFTALQALQKAVSAYDQLIAGGKLEESWETGLQNIEIMTREKSGKIEYRISFQRSEGTPNRVHIFYTRAGEYAGSNFDGS